VIYVDGANSLYLDDAETASLGPYYYRFGELGMSHYDAYVQGLWDQGFLDSKSKVGVLHYDNEGGARTWSRVIKPTLQRLGPASIVDFAFPKASGGGDNRDNTAAQSAVLQFKAAAVDRVLFVASSGDIPFYFMPAAEAQLYRPKYGFSSADSPNFLATSEPPQQMAGSAMVGWNVTKDSANAAADGRGNAAYSRCVAAQRKYGNASKASDYGFACDPFFALQRALSRTSAAVNGAVVRSGFDSLGTSFVLAEPYATRFRPGWSGAVGVTQWRRFDASCSCFLAFGGRHPLS
jgi:hypothetical protein